MRRNSGTGRVTASSGLKPGKGKIGPTGTADYVALGRDLVDYVESGVYIVQSGKFVYVNPFFVKLTGYAHEELIGTRSLKLVLPKDRPAVRKKAVRNLKGRAGSKPYEYRFIKRNGEIMWVLERISSIQYMGKQATLGSCMDITGRRLMEAAVAHSEETYRTILEQLYDSYYEVDLAGNFTFVNDSVCRNLGYSNEEMIGQNYRLMAAPDSIKPLFLAFNEVYRTGEPNKGFEHYILRKDGSTILVETSISLQQNERREIIGFRSISRDITERKQAEEALLKNRDMLNEMGKIAKLGGWEFNVETRIQTWTEEVYNIHELAPDHQPTVEEGLSFYPPEAIPVITDAVERAIQYGEPFDLELPFITAKGNHRWVHAVGRAYPKDGKTAKVEGIFQDITELKQSEEALISSEEKYRSLVENINDVYYTLDIRGNITYISPVMERLTRYKVSDLIGKPFIPLIHPDDLPGVLERFGRLSYGQLERLEFRVLDKDGRPIFVRADSRRLLYADGETAGVTGLMTDITERKRMEQKLEEMATHDFLTGLPNRVLLLDRFNIAAALARRNKARLAIMSLDLDKFKSVNDTLGHDAGDQTLKTISTRLTGIIRASDTLARVGGDEFTLVMLETNHMADATAIAQKILDSFKEPLTINGKQLGLSTSIGVAIYPDDGENLETLTRKSDAAMYYSKGHGRNQFKFFGDGNVSIGGDHRSAPDSNAV